MILNKVSLNVLQSFIQYGERFRKKEPQAFFIS